MPMMRRLDAGVFRQRRRAESACACTYMDTKKLVKPTRRSSSQRSSMMPRKPSISAQTGDASLSIPCCSIQTMREEVDRQTKEPEGGRCVLVRRRRSTREKGQQRRCGGQAGLEGGLGGRRVAYNWCYGVITACRRQVSSTGERPDKTDWRRCWAGDEPMTEVRSLSGTKGGWMTGMYTMETRPPLPPTFMDDVVVVPAAAPPGRAGETGELTGTP